MVLHDNDIHRTDPVTLTQWILTQQQIKVSVFVNLPSVLQDVIQHII